jgi:hypothetical protein
MASILNANQSLGPHRRVLNVITSTSSSRLVSISLEYNEGKYLLGILYLGTKEKLFVWLELISLQVQSL